MRIGRLVIRSLTFYWKTGVFVVFGVAVAAAVIVGSLVVGDSVTGSIRTTTLSRLGRIDQALTAARFFRARLAASPDGRQLAVPVINIEGNALATRTGAAVPRVRVIGVDGDFWRLYDGAGPDLTGRSAAIGEALARDLGVRIGDAVILTVPRRLSAPPGTFLARRDRTDAVVQLRVEIVAVLNVRTGGNFALDSSTAQPRNIFVSRKWLCTRLRLADSANTLLTAVPEDGAENTAVPKPSVTLADYGLTLVVNDKSGTVSLQSRSLLLTPPEVEAALDVAKWQPAGGEAASITLANTIRNGDKGSIAYAVIAGLKTRPHFTARSDPADRIAPGDIVLNTWAAEDLDAKVGDVLDVSTFVTKRDGSYSTESRQLTVAKIIELSGPAADPGLVPDFEGVTNVGKISDWDPPFPFDRKLVTARDEAYWEKHKATPKAFVSPELMREIWRGDEWRGWVTSVRFRPKLGQDARELESRISMMLRTKLADGPMGLRFRPVRQLAMASAKGSTDFGELFLGMSMFLVLAGVGLAGVSMRLSVERRAREMGSLLAFGFKGRTAAWLILCEGAVLALAGAAAGAPLGIAYAAGIIRALQTWWSGAVGTQALWLHVDARTVVAGFLAGSVAGLAAVCWSAWRLRRRGVIELLPGWQALAARPPKKSAVILAAALLAVCCFLAVSSLTSEGSPPSAFFAAGAELLVAALAGAFLLLALLRWRHGRTMSMAGLAVREAASRRGRSLLVFGLLACASFVIVAVAANQRDFSRANVEMRESGAGGFSLKAESSLPIHYDFGTAAGRRKLRFDPKDEPAFKGVRVFSFLLSSGEDVSCLNLAKPVQPRMLGVPDAFIARGGFGLETGADPTQGWDELTVPPSYGMIPAVGDADSVRWQLGDGPHVITGETGEEHPLTVVGRLPFSVFASELLISEANFRDLFPSEQSPRYFLIETPPGAEDAVAAALRRNLGGLGLEVRSTREMLNELTSVQNTYLSTFLTLGGLGVVLGTAALAATLLRSALERRGQFALMLATGFSRPTIATLLVMENVGLVVAGLLCGSASALVAVAPQLGSVNADVNWPAVIGLLAGIMGVGVTVCVVAAAAAVRGDLIEALRAE